MTAQLKLEIRYFFKLSNCKTSIWAFLLYKFFINTLVMLSLVNFMNFIKSIFQTSFQGGKA